MLYPEFKEEQVTVSENSGSGMDPTPVVSEPEKKGEKTAYELYLVKGQTFTAGDRGWSSSAPKVAAVAKNSGKITAKGAGTATISNPEQEIIVSTKGVTYITKGKVETIKFPKVINNRTDWWNSSNKKAADFATTKKDGKVRGIDYGSSNISCLYKGFTFNTTAYVEEPELMFDGKVIENKAEVEMKVGEMKQFKVNKTYQTLNYKSSKQANFFVDENGFVYARKPGKAVISTKINGKTFKLTVNVTE